jgi:glycosyltransferase involved in cell wall biosynthesis
LKAARERGIEDRLHYVGWVHGAEKERVLQDTTIYVLPSYHEGLPVGVLEAMAAGVPVVATRVGGIPDTVQHGCEGELVTPGDVDALTEALDRLLRDTSYRENLGRAGQRRVSAQFDAEVVLERLGTIYRSLGVTPRSPSWVGSANDRPIR